MRSYFINMHSNGHLVESQEVIVNDGEDCGEKIKAAMLKIVRSIAFLSPGDAFHITEV